MLTRLQLKNFMSHVDTTLDLGPGLNVITGPNNCGKSAIVAAIQLVCRNHLTGDVVVRHGAKECSVTLWTDDGHEVTWRRKGKDVSYVIDGTEHSRLKGKVPESLHTILKLPEIEEGDEAFDLHFGLQKEPIFLLDEAGSKAAKFFASSSDAAKLMEMQAAHKSRTRERKSRLKLLGEQAKLLEEQLAKLEPVVALRTTTDSVVAQFDDLQQRILSAERLTGQRQLMVEHQASIETEQQILVKLDELPPWPEFHDTEPLEDWLSEHESAQEQYTLFGRLTEALQQLTPPPSLVDVKALAQSIESHRQYDSQHHRWQSELDSLKDLQPPPLLHIDGALQQAVTRWKQLLEQQKLETSAIATIRDDITALQSETQAYVKKNPSCPVCSQPWQMKHLLSEGHQHG